MKSTPNLRQNKAKTASSKVPAKTRRPVLKVPSSGLSEIIELVNLVPPDAKLPEELAGSFEWRLMEGKSARKTVEEIEQAIAELPPKLAAHLTEYLASLKGDYRAQRVDARYRRIRTARQALLEIFRLIEREEIRYLRQCKNCGRVFFAGKDNQWYCPPGTEGGRSECGKRQRQQNWLRAYEEKYGHPYRPPRKPAHVEKVRKVIQRLWPDGSFERDYETEKEIAAQADITVKHCQLALDYVTSEMRTGTATKQ